MTQSAATRLKGRRYPPSLLCGGAGAAPFRRKLFPYLLVAPAVVYLLMITLYPGVYAIYQSFFFVTFTGWVPATVSRNYTNLLQDRRVLGRRSGTPW